MKDLHVITGLPRSGSTLMCNILNQNPVFNASSTSPLPGFIGSIVKTWSGSIEARNLLEKEREETEERMEEALKAFTEKWANVGKDVTYFDKSRGWPFHATLLKKLYPDCKMIVVVRDLRDVFASVEKQNSKTPLVDEAQNPMEKTMFTRADKMFSPQGLIGGPLTGLEDLLRRQIPDLVFIKYEDLVKDPEETMKIIYKEIGIDYYEHDFSDVKNTANDPDGHYLWKYPHKGEGEVKESKSNWKEHVSEDVANLIMDRFKSYNQFFKYE